MDRGVAMPVWHGIKMSRKRGDRAFLGGRRGAVEVALEGRLSW